MDLDLKVEEILRTGKNPIPCYSTDPAAAFSVLEHFRNSQYTVHLSGDEWFDGGFWRVEIRGPIGNVLVAEGIDVVKFDKDNQREPSFPTAVCRAVLDFGRKRSS
jgi:hypothetical protein